MSKRDIIGCFTRYVVRDFLPHIQQAAQNDTDLKAPPIAA
jgi:hypothetical protein